MTKKTNSACQKKLKIVFRKYLVNFVKKNIKIKNFP